MTQAMHTGYTLNRVEFTQDEETCILDSGCWEDYLSGDEYEEALDRKRFEQSNRGW